MAWTMSGLYICTFRDALINAIALDVRTATHKIGLSNNTDTPNFDADPATWTSTNEVTGTNWLTGGPTLTSATGGAATLTSTTPKLVYDMNDVSVASTTLSNVRGAKIYADSLTPKAQIVGINFGADYSTVAGTFAVTFDVLGVFYLVCHA